MPKPKWQEPVEQTLHFLLGMVLPVVSAIREHCQMPPGDPIWIVRPLDGSPELYASGFAAGKRAAWFRDNDWQVTVEVSYPAPRVKDMLRDLSFACYGSQASIAILVGLLIWRW